MERISPSLGSTVSDLAREGVRIYFEPLAVAWSGVRWFLRPLGVLTLAARIATFTGKYQVFVAAGLTVMFSTVGAYWGARAALPKRPVRDVAASGMSRRSTTYYDLEVALPNVARSIQLDVRPRPAARLTRPGEIVLTLRNRLSPRQVSETVQIVFDDKYWTTLTVDENFGKQRSTTVVLPTKGSYRWWARATSMYHSPTGVRIQTMSGQGHLALTASATYEVRTFSGKTREIGLIEVVERPAE